MSDPSPRTAEDGARVPRATAPAASRPRCPRCGARLGALDAADADAVTGSATSRWYCGCCGVVLDAPRA